MVGTVLYEERISSARTQSLFWGLTAVFSVLFIWRLALSGPDPMTALLLILAFLFLFYSLNYRLLVIRILSEVLRLQFGVFTWTIPLDNVEAIRPDDDLPALAKYGGAGIHFMLLRGRYRASFNFLEYPRVVVALRRSRLVRDVSFSTRRPDEVIRQLHAAISLRGGSINSDPSTSDALASELQEYERQFAAINQNAKALLGDLSERQLEWREDVACWSISDCLNHLVVTGNHSLSHIRSAIIAARSKGMLSAGPFRHSIAGKLLILLMDAPPRVRFKAPRAYRPAEDLSVSDTLAAFWVLQNELAHALREANGVDLARVTVSNPVSDWFKLTLGQEFAFTAAHERRHLWQAGRVRQKLDNT